MQSHDRRKKDEVDAEKETVTCELPDWHTDKMTNGPSVTGHQYCHMGPFVTLRNPEQGPSLHEVTR